MRSQTRGERPFNVWCVAAAVVVAILVGMTITTDADAKSAITVEVTVDGGTWEYVSSQLTVGDILSEAGVTLGEKDEVHPKLSAKPLKGMKIRVVRVEQRVVTQTEEFEFKTVRKIDPEAVSDTVVQDGINGIKEVDYLVTYKDGVKAGYKPISSRVIEKSVDKIVAVPGYVPLTSRAGSYTRSFTMEATAYTPFRCGGSKSGRTATGVMATKGIVAVDPRFIPLGTKLYVEGYGFCEAADTGGAIKGLRIDLCFDTYNECIQFGRKKVQVYVLGRDWETEE